VDASKPVSSIVIATDLEIAANIHKDAAGAIFTGNQFLDLLNFKQLNGLPGAGTKPLDQHLLADCLRFAQKKRNAFISVRADGNGSLPLYEDLEPLPKDIMRHSAMAKQLHDQNIETDGAYDLQFGLDFIFHLLYEIRLRNPAYGELYNKLSIRRGARGKLSSLSGKDQLLLTELIFDVAVNYYSAAERRKAAQLPSLRGRHSTVEFAERFSQAFPGVRGIETHIDAQIIEGRLEKLLHQPLVYSDGTPIWWWRDGNLQIESFKNLGGGLYLMDGYELQIRKIAAVNPGPYDRSFVYVETDTMPPTGLYKHTDNRIAEVARGEGEWGYYWEEYGIVDGVHFVSRAEVDDGAAVIEGHLEDIRGRTEVRTRYVTPYNLVIAAHGSPINNPKFDRRLVEILDSMLKGEDRLHELFDEVLRLPKRPY